METIKERNVYDHETFYFSPVHERADIICEGSDAEETAEQIKGKHLRYEINAERCARGSLPILQSTILKGPFTSGWINPWRYKPTKAYGIEVCAESQLENMVLNPGSVIEKVDRYGHRFYSSTDYISWCSTSVKEDTQFDAAEPDIEMSMDRIDRVNKELPSQRPYLKLFSKLGSQESCEGMLQDQDLYQTDERDSSCCPIVKSVKKQKNYRPMKSLQKSKHQNRDMKRNRFLESLSYSCEKDKIGSKLLEIKPPCKIYPTRYQRKMVKTAQDMTYSQDTTSPSSSTSSVSISREYSRKSKFEMSHNDFIDIESHGFRSKNSSTGKLDTESSLNSTPNQNSSCIFPVNLVRSFSSSSDLGSIEEESLVTDCAPSSQDLSKFEFRKKKRKRGLRESVDISDQAILSSEEFNDYRDKRKRVKRMIKNKQQDDLSSQNADISRNDQEISQLSGSSTVLPRSLIGGTKYSFNNSKQPDITSQNDISCSGLELSNVSKLIHHNCDNMISPVRNQKVDELIISNSASREQQLLPLKPKSSLTHTTSKNILSRLDTSPKPQNSKYQEKVSQTVHTEKENLIDTVGQKLVRNCYTGVTVDPQISLISPLPSQKPNLKESSLSICLSKAFSPRLEDKRTLSHDCAAMKPYGTPITIFSPSFKTPLDTSHRQLHLLNQNSSGQPDTDLIKLPVRNGVVSNKVDQKDLVLQISSQSPIENHLLLPNSFKEFTDSTSSDDSASLNSNSNRLPQSSLNSLVRPKSNQQIDDVAKISKSQIIGHNTNQLYTEIISISNEEDLALIRVNGEENRNMDNDQEKRLTIHESAKKTSRSLQIKNFDSRTLMTSESTLSRNRKNKILFETHGLFEARPQDLYLQNPWVSEVHSLSRKFDSSKGLSFLGTNLPCEKTSSICMSSDIASMENHWNAEQQQGHVTPLALTPKNKEIIPSNFNELDPLQSYCRNDIRKSYESVMKNPWQSIVKTSKLMKPKKRVSFKKFGMEDENILNDQTMSPETLVENSQPSMMNNLLCDDPLSPTPTHSQNSKRNKCPNFSAMAEAFIVADHQNSKDRENQCSSNRQLVSESVDPQTKEELINKKDQILCDNESCNESEQTSWLDSSTTAALKDIDLSKLGDFDVENLLGGIEEFLEDWSVEKVLKEKC